MNCRQLSLALLSLSTISCNGASLRAQQRVVPSASSWNYYDLAVILNNTFDGTCLSYVTDFLHQEPTNALVCERSDLEIILVATGLNDPLPKTLSACKVRDSTSCTTVNLADGPLDLEDFMEQIHAKPSKLHDLYGVLVEYLNQVFDQQCNIYVAGRGSQEPITTIDCFLPTLQREATLIASGHNNPVPNSITMCEQGRWNKKSCHTIEIATESADISYLFDVLRGGLNPQREQYREMHTYLHQAFEGQCHLHTLYGNQDTVTTITCERPDREAILVARGAIDPMPQSLTICHVGASTEKRCHTANLVAETVHSIEVTTGIGPTAGF